MLIKLLFVCLFVSNLFSYEIAQIDIMIIYINKVAVCLFVWNIFLYNCHDQQNLKNILNPNIYKMTWTCKGSPLARQDGIFKMHSWRLKPFL